MSGNDERPTDIRCECNPRRKDDFYLLNIDDGNKYKWVGWFLNEPYLKTKPNYRKHVLVMEAYWNMDVNEIIEGLMMMECTSCNIRYHEETSPRKFETVKRHLRLYGFQRNA